MKKKYFNIWLLAALIFITGCSVENTVENVTHEHSFSEEWTYDDTEHWHKCIGCTEYSERATHNFGDYSTDNNSTDDSIGTKTRTCQICDYKDTTYDAPEVPLNELLNYVNNTEISDSNSALTVKITGISGEIEYSEKEGSLRYILLNCNKKVNLILPDSITSINEKAFFKCENLKSIIIPESVTSIGILVFGYCKNLVTIEVNTKNALYSSENGILFNKDKTSLIQYPSGNSRTIYTIPSSVTKIENYAFEGSVNLISITIPDSITNISIFGFSGCINLTSIIIPNTVTFIGPAAFSGCSNLKSVTLSNSQTTICETTFYGCVNLTSVIIPESVTTIGKEAFRLCTHLSFISIPISVTKLKKNAFFSCTRLSSITYSGTISDWQKIDGYENVTIPVVCTDGTYTYKK